MQDHRFRSLFEGGNRRPGQDLAAEFLEPPGHSPGNFGVVDDAGCRRQDGADARNVRLNISQLRFVDQFHLDAVLQRTFVQGEHALMFCGVGGNDQLAALFVT